jgi:2-amino-4-hydroxy-6-hydroxymethyldihydropteridine diphosphokinase
LKRAYLSLGSNLGNREDALQQAIHRLDAPDLRILRASSVYETEPMDFRNQGWFLNLVVEIETELFPRQLLARVAKVEKEMGRKRVIAKGPRVIDIDILLYGNFVVAMPALEIPHPRMAERRFVLEPLAELAPDLRHPVTRRSVHEMLSGTAGQIARRVAFSPRLPGQE